MDGFFVFGFLAMRFCIIFYIISDSFRLMRLKKLYKKYRDKRLDPKIYFLVTFVLFLLMIKDMIFICFNEIYGIISPLSCYISMIVLWLELRPNFDILDVMYPKAYSLDDEPVKVKYEVRFENNVTLSILYLLFFLIGILAVIGNSLDFIYERIFFTAIAATLCLVFGIKSLPTSHKDKKGTDP